MFVLVLMHLREFMHDNTFVWIGGGGGTLMKNCREPNGW